LREKLSEDQGSCSGREVQHDADIHELHDFRVSSTVENFLTGKIKDGQWIFEVPQCSRAKETLSVILVSAVLVPSFTVFPALLLIASLYLYRSYGIAGGILFITPLVILCTLPKMYSPWFKKNCFRQALMHLVRYVKPFKLLKKSTMASDKNYIFCWHPHGRLFYGFALFCGLFDIWFPELRNKEFFGGINDAMFNIPVLSTLMSLNGMIPCNRKSVEKKLARGDSLGLIVGGIEEVLEGTHEEKDVLYLKNRKGFVKVAMQNNVGLVPVYAFGENQLFQHEPNWRLSFWKFVNNFIKVGAPFPIVGRGGLPIPFRKELFIVVGEPLFAQADETLDEFHARYIRAVEDLFQEHVRLTANPQKKLEIV